MLFNGSFPGEYDARVEEAFAATSLTCRKRIVAGNLRRDHRVPEPRAKKFIAEAEAFLTAYPSKDFEAAHGNYRETWNSYRPLLKTPPEYLLGVNSDNMPAPDPGSPLMHVLDLSKCHEEVSQGRDLLNGDPPVHDPDADDWRGILQDVPDGFREYSRWLGQRLRAPEKSVVVKALLAAHARYTMENGSVPVWATTETAFMRFAGSEPDRWLQAVGMAPRAGHWLIALKYPIGDVKVVARPTVLETESFSHFPSPQNVAHGLAMELSHTAGQDGYEPLPEYVHRAIPLRFEYWENAGSLCGQSGPAGPCASEQELRQDLRSFRAVHWKRIKEKCDSWMTEAEVDQPCV